MRSPQQTEQVPVCSTCEAKLPKTGPRLYVESKWWCPDCLYEHEHGPVERVKPKRSRRSKHPQTETLPL